MHWVLQENMFNEEGFQRLCEALVRLGIPHSFHKVVPFVGIITPEPTPAPGPVIVMGTIAMANEARRRGWWPGSFINDNFDFLVQRNAWGAENLLNGHSVVCRFGEVTWYDPLWTHADGLFFIRPVDDSKAFVGQVMDWPSFEEWRVRVAELRPEDAPTVTLNTLVQIANTKRINAEYRLWIVNRKVVTSSQYKFGTIKRYSPHVDARFHEFAEALCARWVPADAFVLDLADTDDGIKVVEVNNINSAGFYAGDMQRLVMALETYGNREWGRTRYEGDEG
jgi:hypothetical protein